MKAIKCDSCNYWNHIRCEEIAPYDYDKMLKLPQVVRELNTHFCKTFDVRLIESLIYQEHPCFCFTILFELGQIHKNKLPDIMN